MAFTDWLDASLLTRVRSLLSEPNPLFFTNTELLRWIDRGANVLMSTTKGSEQLALYALSDAASSYAFSDIFTAEPNVITVETVFYTGAATATPQTAQAGVSLQKVHPRQLVKSPWAATDTPKWWAERNGNIIIHPTPTTANGAATKMIACLYYRNHDAFDDGTLSATYVYPDGTPGTVCNLPDHMQEVVAWYVLAKANEKMKRYAVSNMFMSIFMNFAVFYRQDSNPKPVDSMDKMETPDYTQFA